MISEIALKFYQKSMKIDEKHGITISKWTKLSGNLMNNFKGD
jgi:hypothetical protein